LLSVACGGETKPAQDPSSTTPATPAPTAKDAPSASTPATPAPAAKDIVDTATGAGQFKTLLAAVKAADLEGTLKGPGPFTVFAPTDEAFAKLPAGTVEGLLKPENKAKLQAILTYHVVSGKVLAADAMKLTTAKTVNGKDLKVAASGGGVKINGANVVKTDIMASNGVIHVIDAVVLPE
jgi:uncharacterized surface protein with fasciclin (FAS1) repeats